MQGGEYKREQQITNSLIKRSIGLDVSPCVYPEFPLTDPANGPKLVAPEFIWSKLNKVLQLLWTTLAKRIRDTSKVLHSKYSGHQTRVPFRALCNQNLGHTSPTNKVAQIGEINLFTPLQFAVYFFVYFCSQYG